MAPQPKGLRQAPPKKTANASSSSSRNLSLRDSIRERKSLGKEYIISADAEIEVLDEYENNNLISVTCTNGKVIELWENWLLDDACFSEQTDGSLKLNVSETITVNTDGKVSWFKNRKARK